MKTCALRLFSLQARYPFTQQPFSAETELSFELMAGQNKARPAARETCIPAFKYALWKFDIFLERK